MSPAKARQLLGGECEIEKRTSPARSRALESATPINRIRSSTSRRASSASAEVDPYELYQKLAGRKSVSRSSPFAETGVRGKEKEVRVHVDPNTGKARMSTSPEQPRSNGVPRRQTEGSARTAGVNGKKKSLLDEQSDARRISFDSEANSPAPQPPLSSPRKRRREPTSSSDDDEDDFQDVNPRAVDPARPHQSGASSDFRRPVANAASVPSPRTIADRTEEILNKIHGHPSNGAPTNGRPIAVPHPSGAPGRKGLGFAWSALQEQFLVDQIEIYGPAWADIARANCGVGGFLEGRDQAKLKDKARNLKEKFIRYIPPQPLYPCSPRHLALSLSFWFSFIPFPHLCLHFLLALCLTLISCPLLFQWFEINTLTGREGRKLPRHFESVTPYGNFNEAKARMVAQGKL